MIHFVDLQTQYTSYKTEIDAAIHNVLDSSQYIMGKEVKTLEQALSEYTHVKHSITCSNGTDALLLALLANGIGVGDEVITSPFTFIATAEVIALMGAVPVFVDIDMITYNIDPNQIEDAITPRTKAIIPISIFGQPADMDEIVEIGQRHHITVIEDAAQSFGASYKSRKSCNLSPLATTSFFPAKPLGCYGDGGSLFTNDDDIANRIRVLLNHGQTERYKHTCIGINGRLDTIQAAILIVKLKHLDEEITARNRIAKQYDNLLHGSELLTPTIRPDRTSVFAQYSVRSKNRDNILAKLAAKAIPTAIHYPIPLYRQEAFANLTYDSAKFPITETVTKEIFSLPMSAFLTDSDQEYIAEVIHEK